MSLVSLEAESGTGVCPSGSCGIGVGELSKVKALSRKECFFTFHKLLEAGWVGLLAETRGPICLPGMRRE